MTSAGTFGHDWHTNNKNDKGTKSTENLLPDKTCMKIIQNTAL